MREMSRLSVRSTLAALLTAALAAAAPAHAQGHQHQHGAPPNVPPPTHGRAGQSYTDADVHFMQGMIGHHAQAIVMARWAESHGASSSIRILAGRVINAQQDEIALMQTWLRDRGQTVPEVDAGSGRVTTAGMEHDHLMPGMLTSEQLAQLDAARGEEFDRLFLTYMIQHHRGAVDMVSELFRHEGAGMDDSVFKLASDVNVDQTTEIARMQRMLADLIFANPTP
jgi:uncharacterized protein (DUF305 family)